MIGNRGNGVTGEARVCYTNEVSERRLCGHAQNTEHRLTNFMPSCAVEPARGIRCGPYRQHERGGQRLLSCVEPAQERRGQLHIRLNPGLRIRCGTAECFQSRLERVPARMWARGKAARIAGWKLFAGYNAIVTAT